MKRFLCQVLILLLPWVLAVRAPAAEREVDLLKAALGVRDTATWKYFSEDPQAKIQDVWTLTDGVLVCKGTPLGYIYTRQTYTNFVLKLEWRIPTDANPHKGGVLVRTTGKPRIWPKSLEAQINHPDAGDFWGLDGYRLDGPADRKMSLEHEKFGGLTNLKKTAAVEKPLGQWNRYEITSQGGTVTLVINGKQVNRATGCEVIAGHICLTAEGNEIQFRNVKLISRDE